MSELHNVEVGILVRRIRESKGINQSLLADKSGVSRQTLNNIESGRMTTTIDTLAAIAKVLDCDLEVIFNPVKEK